MTSKAGDGVRRKTACVTGGSGYMASALLKMLLEKGYAVKTTLRDPGDTEKNVHLKHLQLLGPLEVFRADLDEEGSFDDAVSGCDYAFLVAAPVSFMPENPEEEVIEPAIRGTLNVMRSCVKAGTVKRVILTSSSAAISSRPLEGDGHVLDEESWSDVDFLRANKIGAWGYPASKVLAEKAAAEFAEESGLSLVTLCPVIVVGAAPASKVKISIMELLSLLSGDDAMVDNLELIEGASGSIPLVHIDDVCRAQIFVADKEQTAGRYIVCTLNTTAVALARFLEAKYPQYTIKTDHIGGLPEKPRVSVWSDKLVKEGFEYKYNTLDEIYDDIVLYGRALGILPY